MEKLVIPLLECSVFLESIKSFHFLQDIVSQVDVLLDLLGVCLQAVLQEGLLGPVPEHLVTLGPVSPHVQQLHTHMDSVSRAGNHHDNNDSMQCNTLVFGVISV